MVDFHCITHKYTFYVHLILKLQEIDCGEVSMVKESASCSAKVELVYSKQFEWVRPVVVCISASPNIERDASYTKDTPSPRESTMQCVRFFVQNKNQLVPVIIIYILLLIDLYLNYLTYHVYTCMYNYFVTVLHTEK